MESIVRGLVIYTILLVVFRLAGKRTLSETSSFDLILLLIISETVQQALIDSDNSITNAALLVLTLVGADVLLSILKQRVPSIERLLDGSPVIVMQDGVLLHDRADRERIDEQDILEAAREQRGLERLDQIKFAVLERGGKITVIAR
jgi:uncharacterized membrane protein YcaP (DUF421 family)